MKRLFDLLVASAIALVFFPVMLISALAVYFSMGKPIIFRQRRAGLNGSEFDILKLRTMTDARDDTGELMPDFDRMTVTGNVLRRFRFDELPSLLNVLRGDISVVGPRPLPSHAPVNVMGARRRLSVRPGFTGLSQCSGNTLLSDKEKLAVDLYYVERNRFLFDVAILMRTVVTIIGGEKRNETLIKNAIEQMEQEVQ